MNCQTSRTVALLDFSASSPIILFKKKLVKLISYKNTQFFETFLSKKCKNFCLYPWIMMAVNKFGNFQNNHAE